MEKIQLSDANVEEVKRLQNQCNRVAFLIRKSIMKVPANTIIMANNSA